MVDQDGSTEPGRGTRVVTSRHGAGRALCGDTVAPGQRGHPPPSPLNSAERGNPDAVCSAGGRHRHVEQSVTRKEDVPPQRDRKTQDANAATRKGRESHNPADRATRVEIPGLKGR